MGDYATVAEARAYGYQSQTGDESLLTTILTRASRMFDTYIGVNAGYFTAYVSGAATARKFWGNGTNYLKVDPYLSTLAPTIVMGNDLDSPTFIEINPSAHAQMATVGEFFLVRTYGDDDIRFDGLKTMGEWGPLFALDSTSSSSVFEGWPEGIRVTVTAKWGWDAIPDDVKEAVLETTIAIWRNRDQGFARAVALDNNTLINDVMPPRARLIADRYRLGKAAFA